MKLAVALLLAVSLPVPALADHELAWPPASKILVPSPQYDPWRKPYTGRLTVRIVPHGEVYATCTGLASNPGNLGPKVLACAIRRSGACTIVLPAGAPDDLRKAVRRHEVGHCKGWSHRNTTGAVHMLLLDEEPHE